MLDDGKRRRHEQDYREVMQERELEKEYEEMREEPAFDRRQGPQVISGHEEHEGVAECGCGRQFSWDVCGLKNMVVHKSVARLKCPGCGKVAR